MSLGKRWTIAVVQTSGWSLLEPGLKPPRLCTLPASWLSQSTAPSSSSSQGRTWAGHTRQLSTCLHQRYSEHRQCDHSPRDHEARTQPGEASWSDLQKKTVTHSTLKREGLRYSVFFIFYSLLKKSNEKTKTNNVLVFLWLPNSVCGTQPKAHKFLLCSSLRNGSKVFYVFKKA